jgi:hypothetical protein
MAKTLKDFLEGYLKVKSADEQKFIDKHVTAKTADRNGNGDDVFNGNTKTIDRRKSRKGYNPGEDEKVYEGYHVMRNGQSISYHQDKESADKRARTSNMRGGSNATVVKDDRSVKEELKGSQHKIDANKNGKVDAHDFKLLRGKKKVAEEAEELEELSKATLGSYVKKATIKKGQADFEAGKSMARSSWKSLDKNINKSEKRERGINTAVGKLTKEEAELEEKLTAKTPMGKYIKDFTKSDAPQFKGKSPAKRRVMAIAAKLTAERGGKPLNKEERLQDRLSDISESHQRVMLNVFEKLNEDNKTKFMTACATPEGVEQMLDFAITYRGE